MSDQYETLETTIKKMMSSVPMLAGTDWKYSRICTSIRDVYEKKTEILKPLTDEEKQARNKKIQQKLKLIDLEGN